MLEPEVAFANKNDGIQLSTEMIKEALTTVYVDAHDELLFLSKVTKIDLLNRIKKVVHQQFAELSYSQAVEILNKNQIFADQPITWGDDFSKEQEIYICEHSGSKPLFITDYPKNLKAFYMKTNHFNPQTVACFDLLFPQIGEVVGGSERENNYVQLLKNVKHKNILLDNIQWYLDLRLQGYGGSTGFGLGLDRLLMYITGTENIRDVIPFFSGYKSLKF